MVPQSSTDNLLPSVLIEKARDVTLRSFVHTESVARFVVSLGALARPTDYTPRRQDFASPCDAKENEIPDEPSGGSEDEPSGGSEIPDIWEPFQRPSPPTKLPAGTDRAVHARSNGVPTPARPHGSPTSPTEGSSAAARPSPLPERFTPVTPEDGVDDEPARHAMLADPVSPCLN